MANITLTPKVFLSNQTAATQSGWYPIDYKYSSSQERCFFGTKNTSDTITIESLLSADGVAVTASVTTLGTGVTNFHITVFGPIGEQIRVVKTSAVGAATVAGIV